MTASPGSAGVEIGLERSLRSQARIAAYYNRISMDAGRIHYISKYVLDYARDSWSASACFPIPFALEYQQTLSYKRRADGRMERQFRHFTAAVDITDLFNSRYQEVIGGDMPGRWFGVSLRTR